MKTSFKLAAVAAAAALSTTAFAQVAFDANYENNTTYKSVGSASTFTNDGRVELNAGATAKNGDYFITGKGTLTLQQGAGQGGASGVDDAWVQVGSSMADVKIGRFEAADLFPTGQDTVVEKATVATVSGYTANALRGRATANVGSTSHFAFGLNAGGLRAELGLFNASNAAGTETYGLRPTLVYSAGALTLRGGLENIKKTGASDRNGYGLSVGYAVSSDTSLNLNFASVDGSTAANEKQSSVGLNATIGALGLGAILDRNNDTSDSVTTVYASYKMPLLGIKGASFTPAISNSNGTGATAVTALRARINYSF